MVIQKAIKSYPMVKWFLIASAIVALVGLFMSGIVTDPDDPDTRLFLVCIGIAVLLPFLALAFPRRQVLTMELPTDHLSSMSKAELEGMLSTLDAAKAKGEMDDARYAKARERVLSAIKAKGRPAK
jgi:uncharacterized membrane protein YgaE (UPF0421/DUF939 family)